MIRGDYVVLRHAGSSWRGLVCGGCARLVLEKFGERFAVEVSELTGVLEYCLAEMVSRGMAKEAKEERRRLEARRGEWLMEKGGEGQ